MLALPASWVDTSSTRASKPVSAAISGRKRPSKRPGWRMGVRNHFSGSPAAVRMVSDQVPVAALHSAEAEMPVHSWAFTPVRA